MALAPTDLIGSDLQCLIHVKKWAGDGTAEGGVFDGDVPSSSFSITVEDMELHHFASLTSCLFYFSGKKKGLRRHQPFW